MIGDSITEFYWTMKLLRKLHSLSIVGISYNLAKTARGTHPRIAPLKASPVLMKNLQKA